MRAKVVLFVLLIFLVGQLAAIYLPAMTGLMPNSPTSLFGTYLWSILTGIALFAVLKRKKWIGAILGFAFGFITHTGAYILAMGSNFDEKLATEVRNLNKDLPRQIQESLELYGAELDIEKKEYVMKYRILGPSLDYSQRAFLQENLNAEFKPKLCSESGLHEALNNGYRISYLYADSSSAESIASLTIDKLICK